MSAADAFLTDLWRRGAFVVEADGRLAVDAPRGVLTEEDRASLRRLAPAILAGFGIAPPRCPACGTNQRPGWDWTRDPCAVCHPPAARDTGTARPSQAQPAQPDRAA